MKITRKKSSAKRAKDAWLELSPYGVSLSNDMSQVRPILLFKDILGERILPVWLNPLEAGLAISQQDLLSSTGSPHNLTQKMLKELGVKLEKCCFTHVQGHHQFVELYFSGHEGLQKIGSRADEAMSFCLASKAKFYCRENFFGESQDADVNMKNTLALSVLFEGTDKSPYLN